MVTVNKAKAQGLSLQQSVLAVSSAVLIWSFSGLLIKGLPWNAHSTNCVQSALALLVHLAAKRKGRIVLNRYSLLGGVAMYFTLILTLLAFQLTTIGNKCFLGYSSPIFIMLYRWIHQRKAPASGEVLSSALVILGIAICCLGTLSAVGSIGDLYALLSGAAWGFVLYAGSEQRAEQSDILIIGFFLGTVISLPSLIQEAPAINSPILWDMLVLGLLVNGTAYLLFGCGVEKLGPLNASYISGIGSILAPVWSALFYTEPISLYTVIGGTIVLTASIGYGALNARK